MSGGHGRTGYGRGCRCEVCRGAMAQYMRERRADEARDAVVSVAQGLRPEPEIVVRPSKPRVGAVAEFVRWERSADGPFATLVEARVEGATDQGWLVFLPAESWSHVIA